MESPTLKRAGHQRLLGDLENAREEIYRTGKISDDGFRIVYFWLLTERDAFRHGGPYAAMMYAGYLALALECMRQNKRRSEVRTISELVMEDLAALHSYLKRRVAYAPYERSLLDTALLSCQISLHELKKCLDPQ